MPVGLGSEVLWVWFSPLRLLGNVPTTGGPRGEEIKGADVTVEGEMPWRLPSQCSAWGQQRETDTHLRSFKRNFPHPRNNAHRRDRHHFEMWCLLVLEVSNIIAYSGSMFGRDSALRLSPLELFAQPKEP